MLNITIKEEISNLKQHSTVSAIWQLLPKNIQEMHVRNAEALLIQTMLRIKKSNSARTGNNNVVGSSSTNHFDKREEYS
jgi:hypothetical protein